MNFTLWSVDLCEDRVSWSVQAFKQAGETPSGTEAFLFFCYFEEPHTPRRRGVGVYVWTVKSSLQVRAVMIKHIQNLSQLLISHRSFGWCLLVHDILQICPDQLVFQSSFFLLLTQNKYQIDLKMNTMINKDCLQVSLSLHSAESQRWLKPRLSNTCA